MDSKKVVGAFVGMVLRVIIAIFVLYYLYQTAINAYNFGYRIFADLPCAIAPGRDIQVTVTESMDEKDLMKVMYDLQIPMDLISVDDKKPILNFIEA